MTGTEDPVLAGLCAQFEAKYSAGQNIISNPAATGQPVNCALPRGASLARPDIRLRLPPRKAKIPAGDERCLIGFAQACCRPLQPRPAPGGLVKEANVSARLPEA